MTERKPIATPEQMETFRALASQELCQANAVSAAASKGQWHGLLMMASRALRDEHLPNNLMIELRELLSSFVGQLFRHDTGLRWTIHELMDRAVAERDDKLRHQAMAQDAWIETYSGVQFYPLAPRCGDIFIEDVAHALSNLCRFGGHTGWFYSVAQHSLLVSQSCPAELALEGLLHDAAEAYLLDLPRPVKKLPVMASYRQASAALDAAIAKTFQLGDVNAPSIKHADVLVLTTESRDLMQFLCDDWKYHPQNGYPALADKIVPLDSIDAEQQFLDEFDRLMDARNGEAAEKGGE